MSRMANGTELDLIEQGRNGFVLEDYDIGRLADALLSVIDSPERKAMGDRSKSIVNERWNMSLMVKRASEAIAVANGDRSGA